MVSRSEKRIYKAIGLMSGTSMDGIDVAAIETDGHEHVVTGPSLSVPYTASFRDDLAQAVRDGAQLTDRDTRPGCLSRVEDELTRFHASGVDAFLREHDLSARDFDVIGFHGHTVWHQPPPSADYTQSQHDSETNGGVSQAPTGVTVQIGVGQDLADATGIDVVYDMRAKDVAAGGQGAPMVPIFHRALVGRLPTRPVAIVNVGGVGNVTWVGETGRVLAFDTGPGNALIDDFVSAHTNQGFDEAGAMARRGTPDKALLSKLLRHAFFFTAPPKSLDRNAFSPSPKELGRLVTDDAIATLTAFTAKSIATAVQHMPQEPMLWVIAGGGRKNRTLMEMLAGEVENAVVPAEALELDGDMLEAQAWGYLAVRRLLNLAQTFPTTTGVPEPVCGGVIAKSRSREA